MRYLVVDEFGNDTDVHEFDSKDEAVTYADKIWNRTSEADKRNTSEFYVLESVNPDEDADDHFDGDIVKRYK